MLVHGRSLTYFTTHGLNNMIDIVLLSLTLTPMCVSTLYTQHFPESCETYHKHFTPMRFEPRTLAILEQCHTNYRPLRVPAA